MKISCIWEHNGDDSLVFAEDLAGAFARGESLQAALQKMEKEIISYANWSGISINMPLEFEVTYSKNSSLDIRDADSDIIFDSEKCPIEREEYEYLKGLALKSAKDFLTLYNSICDKDKSCLSPRRTFYGMVPTTARQMYEHTKNVNEYYFSEIDVAADNEGNIFECRKNGFEMLEKQPNFLKNTVILGSYGEEWSLKKMFRRFLWHDRIHARAMYRMAKMTFPSLDIPNLFCFE